MNALRWFAGFAVSCLVVGCGGIAIPPAPTFGPQFAAASTGHAPSAPLRLWVEGVRVTEAQQSAVQSALRLVSWPDRGSIETAPVAAPVDMPINGLHRYAYAIEPAAPLSEGWYAVVASAASIAPIAPVAAPGVLTEAGEIAFPFRVGSAPRVIRIDQCAPRAAGGRVVVTVSEPVSFGAAAVTVVSSTGAAISCAATSGAAVDRVTLDCAGLEQTQDIEVRVSETVCASSGACLQHGATPGAAAFALTASNTREYQAGCRTMAPPL